MEKSSYLQISKGCFLIASPEIDEGIFYRSVILLCEHSLSGSLGFIINKPIDLELTDSIIEMEHLINPNVSLYAGGPLQMNQMMILHNKKLEDAVSLLEGVYLGGDLEFLQQALLNSEGPSVRLLFGYSSWPSGQLEKEFLNGQWFVSSGHPNYVFETQPEQLWQKILREMGGKYKSLSMIPEDLSLN